jgi:uncharacterized peroxidase-related enzyme
MTAASDDHSDSAVVRRRFARKFAFSDPLPDDIQRLVETHHGDAWVHALSLDPHAARRFVRYFDNMSGAAPNTLQSAERELIAAIVANAYGCDLRALCNRFTLGAPTSGAATDEPANARTGEPVPPVSTLSPREQALANLAHKLAHDPDDIVEDDVEKLRRAGFSDPAILEAADTASWFRHAHRFFGSLDAGSGV